MSEPCSFHPDLTQCRLQALAQVLVEARRGALELHEPDSGETNLSLGTRTRERACKAFQQLAEEVDWLHCLVQGYYFLLLIGDSRLPIKFHRTNPDDPAPRTMRELDTESALKQSAFSFLAPEQLGATDPNDHVWRLYFQDDPETREIYSVTLARVSEGGVDERWPIDLSEPVSTNATTTTELPEPADLDVPRVVPLRPIVPSRTDGK